jgi:DNA-binding NarL/FixJ family response regulator
MQKMPNSAEEEAAKHDPGREDPRTMLLDRSQWLYVQNRYRLTPRERQIAELICQGLRNGRIAKYLRIRPGTVKTHVRNIYRKARVASKIAMLLRFVTEAREISGRPERTLMVRPANPD